VIEAKHPVEGPASRLSEQPAESGDLETLNLDSGSLGLAAQAGFDRSIGEDKVFNVDLKYIMIETDVDDMGTPLGTVEVNPLVIGFGFGFRF